MPALGTIVGAPGTLDDFAFWQRAVGEMSPWWIGASISAGAILFVVWGGFVVERHWERIRPIAQEVARPVLGWLIFLAIAGSIGLFFWAVSPPPASYVWTHPTMTAAEQERERATCRMLAFEAIGGAGFSSRQTRERNRERRQYTELCLTGKGFERHEDERN